MTWIQRQIELEPRPRGFHLITDEVLRQAPEVADLRAGLLHVFIQHTSAGLTLNENASAAVRSDFERHFNEMVPENQPYYEHTMEGPDDMPAHIKSSLVGHHLSIPIAEGEPVLGTWQGIYLCEHRNHGGARKLVVTIFGE